MRYLLKISFALIFLFIASPAQADMGQDILLIFSKSPIFESFGCLLMGYACIMVRRGNLMAGVVYMLSGVLFFLREHIFTTIILPLSSSSSGSVKTSLDPDKVLEAGIQGFPFYATALIILFVTCCLLFVFLKQRRIRDYFRQSLRAAAYLDQQIQDISECKHPANQAENRGGGGNVFILDDGKTERKIRLD
ncbi:MAG: hypothetical protein HZB79_00580 [Deltaproteobacteria bacterium]|nr:hypothetical protein [Deltaproteobacteria bacterium]